MALTYGYYPGCSLERNAAAYDISTRAVAGALGFALAEIDDWNCCGAVEYFSIEQLSAYALVARNLALAQRQFTGPGAHRAPDGRVDVVAPCSACFLNLRKTDRNMLDYPQLSSAANQALAAGGLHYDAGSLRARHLLDVVVNDVGCDEVARRVTRPLHGLRLAPYYGCLIARPHYGGELGNAEYPMELDGLIGALGAEAPDFALKTHCCGGHMAQISAGVAYELIGRLLQAAVDCGADALVTLCPMCQLNLDAYQARVSAHVGTPNGAPFRLPIVYFTQMMGLAFGLAPDGLGFGKEFVSAAPLLQKIGTTPPPASAAAREPGERALPMPVTPDGAGTYGT